MVSSAVTHVLTRDRDSKFTAAFQRTLKNTGVKTALTLRQAPNSNAFAERFVLTIKFKCLNEMILFREASLRRAISESQSTTTSSVHTRESGTS